MCFEQNSTIPQCNDPDFDISDISDEMSSLTNLYDKTLVSRKQQVAKPLQLQFS